MAFKFFSSGGAQKTTATLTAPAGAVMDYAGASAPDGWLICDGQEYSQTIYSSLYAIIGATYNTGGETPGFFRVPDARGRATAAPDGGAGRITSSNTLASTGGVESVTLTAAQSGVPAHSHANTLGTISTQAAHSHTAATGAASASHTHQPGSTDRNFITATTATIQNSTVNFVSGGTLPNTRWWAGSSGGATVQQANVGAGVVVVTDGTQQLNNANTDSGTSTSHSHSISADGSHSHTQTITNVNNTTAAAASAHTNVQPYIVLNKIIKY